jgi:hypothetical protein
MTENGAVKRGVAFQDENHYLTKLVESNIEKVGDKIMATPLEKGEAFEVQPDDLVAMNLFCFNKDLIPALGEKFPLWLKENINVPKSEFLIPTVVDELVHENKATVRLLSTPSVWFGVTYKEDKPGVVKALKALVDKGEYKEGLY